MEGRALRCVCHILWILTLAVVALGVAAPAAGQAADADDAARDGGVAAGANATLDTDAARDRARRIAERFAERESPARPSSPAASQPLTTDERTQAQSPLIEQRPLGSSPGQHNTSDDSDTLGGGEGWVLNTLTALGLVIGLVLLLRFGITKFGGRVAAAPSRAVEVLGRTAVAPKNHVLLLRVGGRVLVVGDSGAGLRTLSEIEDPDEVASLLASVESDRQTSATSGFNRLLERYTGSYWRADALADEGADNAEVGFDRARDSVSSLLGRVRSFTGRDGR